MLNRTNRTLSASLNRLNLGTRSVASLAQANLNNGASTLHARHSFAVVMRAGTIGVVVDLPVIGVYTIPSIPGSPSESSWLIASDAISLRVDSRADADADASASVLQDRPVTLFDRSCRSDRKPSMAMGKRRQPMQASGQAPAGLAWSATQGSAVARVAAAGG
jgi:putative N-acetylmannosamine-6-phosphate epimerase